MTWRKSFFRFHFFNGFLLYESGDHADEWNTWIADGWLFDGLGGSLNAVYNSDDDWTTFGGGGVIPEPCTIAMLAMGALGMLGVLRRRATDSKRLV